MDRFEFKAETSFYFFLFYATFDGRGYGLLDAVALLMIIWEQKALSTCH